MKVKRLKVSNFRSLDILDVDFHQSISVIAGTNGCGKTTVLEAIRLVFVVAAMWDQRIRSQIAQTTPGLSFDGSRVSGAGLLRDRTRGAYVQLEIELGPSEQEMIRKRAGDVAKDIARQNYGSEVLADMKSDAVKSQTEAIYQNILRGVDCNITPTVAIDTSGSISLRDSQMGSLLLQILFAADSGGYSHLSYFPADRALSAANFSLQFGAGQVNQNLMTHVIQPQQKYARMKQYLTHQHLVDPQGLKADVEVILKQLLGAAKKSFEGINESRAGELQIQIKELVTGNEYDIGDMSSGEKNVILTYLLLKRSVSPGGVVLLDEPELHFHPEMQRAILPFLEAEIAKKGGVQFVICTHSVQILSRAYASEDVGLFSMQPAPNCKIVPIENSDNSEAAQAVENLGGEPSVALCYRGTIFVEGVTDIEILQRWFSDILRGYSLVERTGRSEVRKHIETLRKKDAEGTLQGKFGFIFDLDKRPESIESTENVRVSQLELYCIENYLLDPNAVYAVYIASRRKAERRKKTELPGKLDRADVRQMIKSAYVMQAKRKISKDVYSERGWMPPNSGFDGGVPEGYRDAAIYLQRKCNSIAEEIEKGVASEAFVPEFEKQCSAQEEALELERLEPKVNGKDVLKSVYEELKARADFRGITESDFRDRLIDASVSEESELWSTLRKQVQYITGIESFSQ